MDNNAAHTLLEIVRRAHLPPVDVTRDLTNETFERIWNDQIKRWEVKPT